MTCCHLQMGAIIGAGIAAPIVVFRNRAAGLTMQQQLPRILRALRNTAGITTGIFCASRAPNELSSPRNCWKHCTSQTRSHCSQCDAWFALVYKDIHHLLPAATCIAAPSHSCSARALRYVLPNAAVTSA